MKKKRGRKAQSITKEDLIAELKSSKNYDKIISRIQKNSYGDEDLLKYYTKDELKGFAVSQLDTLLETDLLNKYSSKGDAKKAINRIIDQLTMSAEEADLKKAKQDAKLNDVTDFDFRLLNKKKATYTDLTDKELDPQDLQSTASAKKVSVEGYYDFGNGYAILKVTVSMPHGSPMPTSILVSSDVLGRIHNAV